MSAAISRVFSAAHPTNKISWRPLSIMAEPIKEGNVLESRGKFDVAFVLAAGIALSGCASQQALEPESHSFMGMPSGSKEEVADMFRVPDHWPDGAPTKAIHRGEETGVWQPVGSTEGSCIEYRLIPNDERYKAPEQPHYWDGAMFKPTKANCTPVQDQAADVDLSEE